MTQHAKILWEMRKHGGRITTYELMEMRISQYQARLKELRVKGFNISEAQVIEHQPGNFMYVLYEKETSGQMVFA